MGRGKAREKILHELLTRCPGSFCPAHCTDLMGTSKHLCYPVTYQLCIKGSQGIWPSAHKGELCHCLSTTLAPCVTIANPPEPVNYCHHSKPATFTLHLYITRSLHPADTWNSWISCIQACPEFDDKTGKKNTNKLFFFFFLPQKSCNNTTKRIPLTSGGQKKKWQLKQQFWRSIFRKIKGNDLLIN